LKNISNKSCRILSDAFNSSINIVASPWSGKSHIKFFRWTLLFISHSCN